MAGRGWFHHPHLPPRNPGRRAESRNRATAIGESIAERVFLGLGSNIGTAAQKLATLRLAISSIERLPGVTVVAKSSAYRNPPWGYEQQDEFLNAVVELRNTLDPHDLLLSLKTIEADMGRQSTFRWGPRLIDIDILMYGNRTVKSDTLNIPHPHMAHRPFVLIPLLEIWRDAALPDGTNLSQLPAAVDTTELVRVEKL